MINDRLKTPATLYYEYLTDFFFDSERRYFVFNLRSWYFYDIAINHNDDKRASLPEVFWRKGVLKICSKFTGEQACRSAVSIKLRSNFIEMAFRHACSPVNLLHIFRTAFPRNSSGWLLLVSLASARSVQYMNTIHRLNQTKMQLVYLCTSDDVVSRYRKRPVTRNGLRGFKKWVDVSMS